MGTRRTDIVEIKHLIWGRKRRIALKYLLIGVGVSGLVLALKYVGYAFGGPELFFSSLLAPIFLVFVTLALGAAHAKANGGVLITLVLVYLPFLAEREFEIVFGVGHPNPDPIHGALLAFLVALPIGVIAYVIGRRF